MNQETDFLSLDDLLHIADRVIEDVQVRDVGLLESAVHRPRATVFGEPAYPNLLEQAGALMHSLARNHTLVDGNKRLAWAALRVFLSMNRYEIEYEVDEAESFVIAVTVGSYDVVDIAAWLRRHAR